LEVAKRELEEMAKAVDFESSHEYVFNSFVQTTLALGYFGSEY
jgi:hypothetical protein